MLIYHVPSQNSGWGTVYHPRACTGIFWAKIRAQDQPASCDAWRVVRRSSVLWRTGPELGSTTVSLCRPSTGQTKHGLAVPKPSPCLSTNHQSAAGPSYKQIREMVSAAMDHKFVSSSFRATTANTAIVLPWQLAPH